MAGPFNRTPDRSRGYRGNKESDHPDWESYTYVKVFLKQLPENVTTLEIYANLFNRGTISQIIINDNRNAERTRTAEVYFKPPPHRPPWRDTLLFKQKPTSDAIIIQAFLAYDQQKNFTIKNPISGVPFNEETIIKAASLDFGVLKHDQQMNVMHTVRPRDKSEITLALNLKRMELEVSFPILLDSTNKPKVRLYKFRIALDEAFGMYQTRNADGSITYIINVRNPPWYTRKLANKIGESHVTDAKRWFEDDMWNRQTDIVAHKDTFAVIDQTPIGLRKNLNSINIARWTTFALKVAPDAQMEEACRVLTVALKDFNNRVLYASNFKVDKESHAREARYWNLIEKPAGSPSFHQDWSSIDLSFEVRYQLEVCLSHGLLSEYEIGENFLQKLSTMDSNKAKQLLVHVDVFGERVFDPMNVCKDLRYQKPVRARQIPSNCIEIHHATVTATSLLLNTPSIEISNRVIRRYRHYSDRFLRVRFEDDDYRGQTKLYSASNNRMTLIFERVKRAMKCGLIVAGRKYEFLAWGNSQLRDHGCYFFAAIEGVSASSIRAEMGAFDHEKIVAKRAARMGQCFSTTLPIHLRISQVTRENTIPDIVRGKYTFSDGVGKISQLAAQVVHANLKLSGDVPSVFQFRMGGCKGVLAVDPTLKGIEVQVRASQFKFDSASSELEIIRCSEFWQPFLNRQLIMVLEALGVPVRNFMDMQQATIDSINLAMRDERVALKALRDNVDPNRMTLAMCDLIDSGFQRAQEPFIMSLLSLWRAWSLKFLKEKAKIPIAKGAFVLGTLDETGKLKGHYDSAKPAVGASRADKIKSLPEIFLQIKDPQSGKLRVIEGVCILARNPSLHLGDIRVVHAVNEPALHHLRDCVVMPQNGDRDLPSMCSGGDLDGDDYIVAWDEKLIPSMWNAEPFHYDAPPPKAASGEITVNHMIDFYYDYLQNDFLGRIAHAHLGAADYLELGIQHEDCLRLLHLHSMAVDYPKTGVPANLPRELERTQWPHFMEKRGRSYKSHKVLGKLFDAATLKSFKPMYHLDFDKRILNSLTLSDEMKHHANVLKNEYDMAIQRIMVQHKIRTEFEVWSTFVMHHSKASSEFKFHEEIGQLSRCLKEEFYNEIVRSVGGNTFEHLREFAVAAYQLTAAECTEYVSKRKEAQAGDEPLKEPLMSFPWLLADVLGKIASSASIEETAKGLAAVAPNHPFILNVDANEFEDDVVIVGATGSASSVESPPGSPVGASPSSGGSDLVEITEAELETSYQAFQADNSSGFNTSTTGSSANRTITPGEKVRLGTASSSGEEGSPVHVSQGSSLFGSPAPARDKMPTIPPEVLLPDGCLRDPRSMTEAQQKALFGGDDDLP